MNTSLVLIFIVSVVTLAQARVRGASTCLTSEDCAPNQCCLSPAVFDGKRQAGGYCTDSANIGDKCYVNNQLLVAQHPSTLYFNACPCQTGHQCLGTGFREVPQGEVGVCQLPAAKSRRNEGGACASRADCASDECCVSTIRPIGKKKRAIFGLNSGTCQKLGKLNDSCLVSVTSTNEMNFACPCQPGLTCHGSGFFDIPLGETGNCK